MNNLIAGDIDKETFDDLHRQLVKDAQRQSERDFPWMSVCNGITDGTKMCGSERVGNAFILLCLFHTQLGQNDRHISGSLNQLLQGVFKIKFVFRSVG